MNDVTRRSFIKAGSLAGAVLLGPGEGTSEAQASGFTAASSGPERRPSKGPGVQGVSALCEITGGGLKVYGIAVEYDAAIDSASLAPDTYTATVSAAVRGQGMMGGAGAGGAGGPGGPPTGPGPVTQGPGQAAPAERPIAAVYTNASAALLPSQRSVAGRFVILEFKHDADLSAPTRDGDRVSVTQHKPVRTAAGAVYPAVADAISNAGQRGNSTVVRSLDAWEQNHWWWDDAHATYLEYSIRLPQSFLQPGGENKAYPLVLAVTHSGTSYTGTCTETLTDGVIASIWGMPEVQAQHECVVITPRYERTTMNDYWEHTYDVENTHRLVEFLISGRWNYGNPNRTETADKRLKIDPARVYTTGWSMGAMTSLWLMAHHPETYAAGLIIAGQQRPSDVVTLAKQKVLIITGSLDEKATPWNEKCVPVWRQAGAKVTRPQGLLDPALIFPTDDQQQLNRQVQGYLDEGGNITFLTFAGVDHMSCARKFFYIRAAREWLFRQHRT